MLLAHHHTYLSRLFLQQCRKKIQQWISFQANSPRFLFSSDLQNQKLQPRGLTTLTKWLHKDWLSATGRSPQSLHTVYRLRIGQKQRTKQLPVKQRNVRKGNSEILRLLTTKRTLSLGSNFSGGPSYTTTTTDFYPQMENNQSRCPKPLQNFARLRTGECLKVDWGCRLVDADINATDYGMSVTSHTCFSPG